MDTSTSIEAKKRKKLRRFARTGAAVLVVGTALVATQPAFAITATTPVDSLKLETAKLKDVYNDVTPVAVGAAVFGIGMVLIKRVAFS